MNSLAIGPLVSAAQRLSSILGRAVGFIIFPVQALPVDGKLLFIHTSFICSFISMLGVLTLNWSFLAWRVCHSGFVDWKFFCLYTIALFTGTSTISKP